MLRSKAKHTARATVLSCALAVIGLLAVAICAGIPLAQTIEWLRTGFWTPCPTQKLLVHFGLVAPDMSDWVGAQRIVDFLLDAPFAVVGGGPLALMTLWIWSWAKKERRLAKLEQFQLRKKANWPPPL